MDDLVKRSDVIVSLMDYTRGKKTIGQCIDDVPSAQPEIITCGECARCQLDAVFHDYWCDGKKVWKNHFCGYAERREDV